MRTLRLISVAALLCLAASLSAQTEYVESRNPALQRLGRQLQAGQLDEARRDLAAYLAAQPGDGLMQYNLACLDAVAGDTDAALLRLDRAYNAGYRDLERPLHDPDLVLLADDPRLAAKLDSTRSVLVAAMQDGAVFLEERVWSEPLPLAPDTFGPGAAAAAARARVRFDAEVLEIEVTPSAAGADEVIVCVALPTNLEVHETNRWFEFRALLANPGPVDLTGRHGRIDAEPRAATLARRGKSSIMTIPWPSLHPYRPPVELVLGLNVVLRRVTGMVPADRWALIRDPHAASGIQPWRRFVPVNFDPGLAPTPLVAGRLDTYLVIGDSLSAEIGIQGLPAGPATVARFAGADTPDSVFTADLEPDLAYLTLPFALPPEPVDGWFDLGVDLTAPDGKVYRWRDRAFRLHPDWFIEQNERLAGVAEPERAIVQYPLFRALRGQQQFQPHDDPGDIAAAAAEVVTLLDRAEATGSVLPPGQTNLEVGYPVGDDALQEGRLILPRRADRAGATLVVVAVADRDAADRVAHGLAANRPDHDRRQYFVIAVPPIPGRPDLGAAVVAAALVWVRGLLAPDGVRLAGNGAVAAATLLAGLQAGDAIEAILIGSGDDAPTADLPANVSTVTDPGDDPVGWAAQVRNWR